MGSSSFCHRMLICALCALLVTVPVKAEAQQSKTSKQKASTPAPQKNPSGDQPKPETSAPPASGQDSRNQAISDFESTLAKGLNAAQEDSDYVPCFFTAQQLLQLRPVVPTTRLTGAEAESFVSNVMDAVVSAKIFSDFERSEIVSDLSTTEFENLTSSAALAKVVAILQNAESSAVIFSGYAKDTTGDPIGPDKAKKLVDAAVLDAKQVSEFNLSTSDPTVSAEVGDAMKSFQKYLSDQHFENMTGPDALSALASSSTTYATALKVQKQSSTQPEVQGAVAAGAQGLSDTIRVASTERSNANAAIVNGARSQLGSLKRPLDIACAMSVLSWSETRFAFGRLIANEYIGVQIIVRNVNEKQEFLLQDAAVAVDSDLSGRKGRFFSGRDRIIVRALTVTQKDDSPRNIFINALSGVGIVMSTVVPFVGAVNFTDATTAFNVGLVPGLGKVWTDNTTDQIKLLDDIGFSSSMNQKTVVPKSGTVMFVMFVPAKPFQQGWWTQPCAETLSNGLDLNPPHPPLKSPNGSTLDSLSGDSAQAGDQHKVVDDVGLDLNLAYQKCQGSTTLEVAKVKYPTTREKTYYRNRNIPYKHWSPNADAIFRELAFAVVSGIHIQEASQTKPSLAAVDCPEDKLGNVDFSKQASGAVSCSVTGQNLDQVAKLRLRNAQDATDSKTAEGDVTVNGDATSAKVSFPLSQIGPLDKTAYKVYSVTKNSVEDGGGQTLHFALSPFVQDDATKPAQIDLAKLDSTGSASVALSGYHLDKVIKIDFKSTALGATSPANEVSVSNPSATSLTFSIKPTDDLGKVVKDTAAVTVTASLVTSNSPQPDPQPTASLKFIRSSAAGTATGAIDLQLSGKSFTFVAKAVKTSSPPQTLIITNAGSSPVNITAANLTGAQKAEYSVVSNCAAPISKQPCPAAASGGSIAITIVFKPLAKDKGDATLNITDSNGKIYPVVLTGTLQ
jgi:hypothetical protein